MRKRKGFTLIELIVVIAIIIMLLTIFMPPLSRVKKGEMRVVCGRNLKGLGRVMAVYATDYDGEYVKLGNGIWSKELGFSYEDTNYIASEHTGPSTITSSLYLLVREADVSPKSFVCPESDETEYDGQELTNLDIVEVWDFGSEPHQHVSYAYHNPYGQYPANSSRSASFAVMGDMSPWFFMGDIMEPGQEPRDWTNELPEKTTLQPPQIINITDKSLWKPGNSVIHFSEEKFFQYRMKYKFGQNILYADGHVDFTRYSNVGVDKDNIYTFWSTEENPTEQDRQGGTAPTSRSPENDAKSKDDSFLAI
ncbi:MAG: type II secretion system protein [Planctomycetota bacterium]